MTDSIPDFQSLMLPVLKCIGANGEMQVVDVRRIVSKELELTEDDLEKKLPSGTQSVFTNRVAWALSYMKRAGLLESVKRGTYRISEAGARLLQTDVERIDIGFLIKYEGFKKFRAGKETEEVEEVWTNETVTPEERLEAAYSLLHQELSAELLDTILKMDPYKFEQLVLDLLLAMGYGGQSERSVSPTQRSNDEGIDGIINQDRLGLDVVYVQAKRWGNSIGRKEIQSFVGALAGKQASKGIFITTSDFSKTAEDYANSISSKVILISGLRLTSLMIEFNVGVAEHNRFVIKRIDSDYFEN